MAVRQRIELKLRLAPPSHLDNQDAPCPADGALVALPVFDSQAVATRVSSPRLDAWRRFRRNRAATAGLVVVVVASLTAIFAPLMHTSSPLDANFALLNAGPSLAHWFGTDGVGRDEYSRLLYGMRVPLAVGFIGTAITVVVGTLLGVVAGFLGGPVDGVLSRFTDLMFAFPGFLLAILIVALYGQAFDPLLDGYGRVLILIGVFAFVTWPGLMRFVRSLTLTLKEQPYVEAARTSGSSTWKIIRRHLVPNIMGLILVQAALITVGIIYQEVALSIFGLGIPSPQPDPGVMLYQGSEVLGVSNNQLIFPAIFLSALLLAVTFIGDGIRDAVDPRMDA